MNFSAPTPSEGVLVSTFHVDGPTEPVPGVLWSPVDVTQPRPLVLMGHGGGLHKRAPGLVARALDVVTGCGFHAAAIDAPGHGERTRSAQDERLVTAIREARRAGRDIEPFVVELNESLADRAVPEWRATIDALAALPQVAGRFAYTGMTVATAIGIPLVADEPRIVAAVLGGYFGTGRVLEAARRVTIPVQWILSADDPELGRESMLALFDAIGSADKTLWEHAGSHKKVPWQQVENRHRWLVEHLTGDAVGGSGVTA